MVEVYDVDDRRWSYIYHTSTRGKKSDRVQRLLDCASVPTANQMISAGRAADSAFRDVASVRNEGGAHIRKVAAQR